MTATPTTTKPGPDQAALRDLMRRLAEVTSTDAPVISAYLDVRPAAHGERPAERSEQIVVRDRLRQLGDGIEEHSPAGESIKSDRERIERFLEEVDLSGVEGMA